MRDLKLEEIGHVYGAGGKSDCAPGHNKDCDEKGSKGSKGSKQSKGSKGSKSCV